ncbi:MAG TPA: 4a-hydroxytetrahydrobiopterin dehydratase [Pyrinomonadaceae bacterium]|nr:4a-hydroxytetrahydrobiopterin dehydratase [Pyrinomonadaceae bacterium]
MERRKLSPEEVVEKLKGLSGWTVDGDAIKRRFEFNNFAESLEFVNEVGAIAEEADHHPDITLGWGYAEIVLTTHDRGGVTDMDIALARKIDGPAS